MKAVIIAAPSSGSGKTTVTLGIMESLKRRGLTVAPFKVGPDFIDPGYHRMVTGRPSVNLDSWMCSEAFVRETFARHANEADIAVIEGVMGLFDGLGGTGRGSTAEIAKLLRIPVVLVVDAAGQAGSVAALVKGFAEFDPEIVLAGVILNNVASPNHRRILVEAVTAALPGIPVIGAVRREESLMIPSRHLGLVTADENPLSPFYLHRLARIVEEQLDLDLLLGSLPEAVAEAPAMPGKQGAEVEVAVARDSAFCFVYEDNLRLLREAGARLRFFSPINDRELPEGVSGIYLPGGYPELFAEQLAENFPMKSAVRKAAEAGMPLFAECGGFIYLTRGVAEEERVKHFVGLFPVTTRMLQQRKALGYREVETLAETVIGVSGMSARGHEFHYSETEPMPEQVERIYRVTKQGQELGTEGYRYRNCIASYVHLHFGSNPEMARNFVENCRKFQDNRIEVPA
jgi:cobyrinic acid a,c-diamide synthase